jgi:hypothetical protein
MVRIGFGTNDRLHSRLIRAATDSRWSHTWIEYESALWGGRWVAHASPTGVVKVPIERVLEEYPEHVRLSCSADLRGGFAWARSYVGAPYDYGVIWNGLIYAVHRATDWDFLHKIVWRNTAKFTCSEFVTGFLRAADVRTVAGLEPELTPPVLLWKVCMQSGEFALSSA